MPKKRIDYYLRNVPADLWERVHAQSINEAISIRELILRAIIKYLKKT